MTPLVSVCIPAYNGERFIGATVASVLAQTLDDLELVVCDDFSTDGTVDVLRGFDDPRIRLVNNDRNIGAIANWNRAREEGQGAFVKMLSDDDVLYPSCLERQVDSLRRHPKVALAVARRDIIDEDGRVLFRNRGLRGLEGPAMGTTALRRTVRAGTNVFGEPAFGLVRRDVLQRCPPFDQAFPYAVDLHLWCEVLQRGDLYADSSSLGAFRVQLRSESVRIGTNQSAQVRGLYRHLRRQRPDIVTRSDVAIGSVRSFVFERLRLALYRRVRRASSGTTVTEYSRSG